MSFSVGYSESDYCAYGGGGGGGGGGGVVNNNNNGSTSSPSVTGQSSSRQSSIQSMDEAYRRLGHKLSQRVTSGEQYRVANVVIDLGSHPQSAFSTDDNNNNNNNNTAAAGMHNEVSLEKSDEVDD